MGVGPVLADVCVDRAQLHEPADGPAVERADQSNVWNRGRRSVRLGPCRFLHDLRAVSIARRFSDRPLGPALVIRWGGDLVVDGRDRDDDRADAGIGDCLPGLARCRRVVQLALWTARDLTNPAAVGSAVGQWDFQLWSGRRRGCDSADHRAAGPAFRLASGVCGDRSSGVRLGRGLASARPRRTRSDAQVGANRNTSIKPLPPRVRIDCRPPLEPYSPAR